MEDLSKNHIKLPEPQHHLLLPKGHVHFFWQVVLFVVGLLSFLSGVILYFMGFGEKIFFGIPTGDLSEEAVELFFFLGVGGLMGLGLSCLLVWALWKFVTKYRIRFVVTLAVSSIAIISGLVSIASTSGTSVQEYTFYFFALTIGLLVGLSSLYFFFLGLSRHIFGTHKYDS